MGFSTQEIFLRPFSVFQTYLKNFLGKSSKIGNFAKINNDRKETFEKTKKDRKKISCVEKPILPIFGAVLMIFHEKFLENS